MKILGIIPSRFASTRFPGKPLAMINGKTMIQRVYQQAKQAESLQKVVVATDDNRIYDHVKDFEGAVVMTSAKHQNGTSRCAEVIEILESSMPETKFDVVVNIQGDEPYIHPLQIDTVAGIFNDNEAEIGTLVKKITSEKELTNPNVVKVVFTNRRLALYFSRQPIPFFRDVPADEWINQRDFYKHIGIYGYRTAVLKKLSGLPVGELETAEKLEQLRWLENGYPIKVEITDFESIAVDTPKDLLKFNNNS